MGLKLHGAKSVNIHSSISIYSRSDSLISESGKKHYSLDPLRIFVIGSEAMYDS